MRDIKVGEEVVVDYSQYKRDSLVYDMQLRQKELPGSNMSYENSPAKIYKKSFTSEFLLSYTRG